MIEDCRLAWLDTRFTHDLSQFYPKWEGLMEISEAQLPRNRGDSPDWKGRYLDCAVFNAYFSFSKPYDTVRMPPPHANAENHRRVMEKLETMTPEEALAMSVKAGIHTPDGKLTAAYKPPEDQIRDQRGKGQE